MVCSPKSLTRRWYARLVTALALAALLLWPYPAERLDSKPLVSTRVVERHGRLLHDARSADGGYARWVPLAEVSPHVVLVTLSAEDANFRWHPGVDPTGVARALWLN